MLSLLHPKPKVKAGDSCPDCQRGTLYRVGKSLCCSRCTFGWSWHR